MKTLAITLNSHASAAWSSTLPQVTRITPFYAAILSLAVLTGTFMGFEASQIRQAMFPAIFGNR